MSTQDFIVAVASITVNGIVYENDGKGVGKNSYEENDVFINSLFVFNLTDFPSDIPVFFWLCPI